MSEKQSKRVVAFVPLPPPYAGPELATEALLNVLSLQSGCALKIVRANVRLDNAKKGRFDGEGIWNASKSLLKLFWTCLSFRPQKVYLLISPSKAGFLRDAVAILIAKLLFCKVVGHYHGSHFQYFYQNASSVYRFLIRKGIGQLSWMFVQAERLKQIFFGLLPPSKLSVLYNGISEECYRRGSHAANSRKERKTDCVTFLFLNHISFTKGFYDLIHAYKKLLREGGKARLLVAGDFIFNPKTQEEFLEEPYRQLYRNKYPTIHREMVDFIQNKSLPGVEYHGVVRGEQKYLLFEQADVFILPSYTEGFPNVVLEALAFGLALIVTPVGALPEVLEEPANALFVERGDAESLFRQMHRLIAYPSICFQMGTRNRELVGRAYRMQFIGSKFRELMFNEGREQS